jgi:hypothetical protein
MISSLLYFFLGEWNEYAGSWLAFFSLKTSRISRSGPCPS